MFEETLEETAPSRARAHPGEDMAPVRRVRKKARRRFPISAVLLGLILGLAIGIYLFAPLRTNILLLGIDRAPEGTSLARSDTMVLFTVIPQRPDVAALSIPRDLWVTIPGAGENRINTAHFFAEDALPGSGPEAAKQVVMVNFGVDVHYYVRVRFDSVVELVDALGGLEIELEGPAAGLAAGTHTLSGEESLAFVRSRQGDDFFRMANGQLFVRALFRQLLRPRSWASTPAVVQVAVRGVDTDVPIWEWPRIGLALLRAGPDGVKTRAISRDMVGGFTTPSGAQVLLPNWDRINPVLLELFGQ